MTQAFNLALLANNVNTAGKLNAAVGLYNATPVANGGTNLTATPVNGQLLIGNGTGYTLATLTPGTNMSITNGAGSITLNQSIANGSITAPMLSGGQTGSAPIYGCRAWVNFNGTGTIAIRASGNVSSIADNGDGDYTINFTSAMPDANFSCVASQSYSNGTYVSQMVGPTAFTTGSVRIKDQAYNGASFDSDVVNAAIFR